MFTGIDTGRARQISVAGRFVIERPVVDAIGVTVC
jgi:hypothetical protein